MLRRLKNRIRLKILKIKMTIYERHWKVMRKKELDAYQKVKSARTDYFYAVKNLDPKKEWEARAELENMKANL